MGLNLLFLDDETKGRIAAVVDFATRPENYYYVGVSSFVPGNCEGYVAHLNNYRCVFSISIIAEIPGQTDEKYRHLSISVPDPKLLANPVVVFTLARMFGFTYDKPAPKSGVVNEPASTWSIGIQDKEHTVVVVESIVEDTREGDATSR